MASLNDSNNLDYVEDEVPQTPTRPSTLYAIPYVGMEFESLEKAQSYYEEYGRQQGFWIRMRDKRRGIPRCNEFTMAIWTCSRAGKPRCSKEEMQMKELESYRNFMAPGEDVGNANSAQSVKSRNCSSIMIGCKAHMRVKLERHTLKLKVVDFSDDHNHEVITPKKRMNMRSNRRMPDVVKKIAEDFQTQNLRVSKVPAIFCGDQIGFDSRDCYNHLAKVRQKNLDTGDAQFVLNYFRQKQLHNPQFFYAVQCDEEGRATNFFWVDPRSRMAYDYFGDVVVFDTTYRTNKYNMPFAPFTGVNHHFQSIQFGCALLQDETEDTFIWLFDTWLQAMGGRAPVSILTDQDLAMRGAIAKVFPSTTRHRLCLWHIKKKFGEKLSHVYFSASDFKKKMKACVHWTYSKDVFDEEWKTMMCEFHLEGNKWLQNLFEMREMWAPVYNRDTFYAGMNTTGRAEGINSFFDDFVTSTTNLREFVQRYDEALKKIVRNEEKEDFESEHKVRIVAEGDWMLNHAADVYTRALFNKFKFDWALIWQFKIEKEERNPDLWCFHLKTRDKVKGYKQQFVVQLNPETYVVLKERRALEIVENETEEC